MPELTLGLNPTIGIISYVLTVKPSATITVQWEEGEDPTEKIENAQEFLQAQVRKMMAVEIAIASDVLEVAEECGNDLVELAQKWQERTNGEKSREKKGNKKTVTRRKKTSEESSDQKQVKKKVNRKVGGRQVKKKVNRQIKRKT